MILFSIRIPRSISKVGQGLPIGGEPSGHGTLNVIQKENGNNHQCLLLRCVSVIVPNFIVNPIQKVSLQILPECLLIEDLHLRGEKSVQGLCELVIVSADEGRHTQGD